MEILDILRLTLTDDEVPFEKLSGAFGVSPKDDLYSDLNVFHFDVLLLHAAFQEEDSLKWNTYFYLFKIVFFTTFI